MSPATSKDWPVEPHLFGVPDLCSICVHNQQLLVAFARGKANLFHPATMCWYSPENISGMGHFGTKMND